MLRLKELARGMTPQEQSCSETTPRSCTPTKSCWMNASGHELRLGFFETDDGVVGPRRCPRHFPGRLGFDRDAGEQPWRKPQGSLASDKASPARSNQAPPSGQQTTLSEERVTALLADAKSAIVRGDFEQSIGSTPRLVQQTEGSQRARRASS